MRERNLPRVHPAARPRPRLLELLDRWRPVTVLHGPAGSGKTTLAAQWALAARERGERIEWYDGQRPVATVRADERVALVVDRADRLAPGVLAALVDEVRRTPGQHLVLCVRAGHDLVARIRAEVETELVGPVELALDPTELREVAGDQAPADVLAWTGGHVGTVVAGLPDPAVPAGWSRERARAALAATIGGAPAYALLPVLAGAPVPVLLLGRLVGGRLADLEQVAGVVGGDEGLRFLVGPGLREVLREQHPPTRLPPATRDALVRHRWWTLLRDDPATLRELVAGQSGPVAAALRGEDGPDGDPVAGTVRVHLARRRGDLDAATAGARRLEPLLDTADPDARHRLLVEAGLVALEAGDLDAARRWWERAAREPDDDGEAAAHLALVAAVLADHEELGRWRARTGTEWHAAGQLAAAVAALDRRDRQEAARRLSAARAVPGEELWFLHAAVRAQLAVHTPARADALHGLREERAARARQAPPGPFATCALDGAEVDLLLAQGRATEAAAIAARLPDHGAGRLRRGRVAMLAGDLDTAYAELAGTAHPTGVVRRVRVEALLLLAELHRRAGRADAVREATDRLAAAGPWPRLAELLPGGSVYPATAVVVELTPRERTLLELLREPVPRDRMAAALFVSTNTVKTQLQGLYRKLGATTREEAVARAFELGLME